MPGHRNAFTLIELLVVVAIIALLMTIMLPALGSAQMTARRCRALSDLRQLMLGYHLYAGDHHGQVLYGYAPGSVHGSVLTVTDGARTYAPPVVNRYPWRLSAYVSNAWYVMYSSTQAPPRPSAHDSDSDAFSKAYNLSVSPEYGINAVFVGGYHSPFYKGFLNQGTTTIPNANQHVVFRDVQVRQPAELIIFTEVRRYGGGAQGTQGHFWVTPPRAAGHMWRASDQGFEILDTSRTVGLPQSRYGQRTVTAFFDGHVKTLGARELDNMRLWANNAQDNTYDIP